MRNRKYYISLDEYERNIVIKSLNDLRNNLIEQGNIAQQTDDSKTQIQRYIRLTNLIPELLQLADEGRIAFTPAVELSYLTPKQRKAL